MLHRNKKERDENKDKWIGVGGKFLENESPEGLPPAGGVGGDRPHPHPLAVPGIVTFVSDQWPTEYMHLFTADQFTGELQDCMEGDLCWVEKSVVPFPSPVGW